MKNRFAREPPIDTRVCECCPEPDDEPKAGCKLCGGRGVVEDSSENDAYWNAVNSAIDEKLGK